MRACKLLPKVHSQMRFDEREHQVIDPMVALQS
jgi:hypothetical protein